MLDQRHPVLGGGLAAFGIRVDDDEVDARNAQVMDDLAADAAVAADDEVVLVGVDHSLHLARRQQAVQLAGDEELRHRCQPVKERTYAE